MCGHVGVAGQLALKDEKLFKHLLMFDYFRGPDSTGAAVVRGNGDVYIAKLASHPVDLFDTQRFKTALNGNLSRCFLGHNRAATRGVVNGVNAHPYIFGHIVGAHNGTLDHSCIKDLETAAGDTFNVDSQALYAAIAAVGIEAAIPMTQGAWALVWYDMKDKTLNFLRNKERPMWIAYAKDFSRMIWASQWEFIHAAAMANDVELFTDDKGVTFWQPEDDVMYSYDLDQLGRTKERPKPKAKKLEGKPKYAPVTGNYGGGTTTGFFPQRDTTTQSQGSSQTTNSGGRTNSSGGTRNSTASGLPRKDRVHSRIAERWGTVNEPFAGIIDHDRFDELAKDGCSWCGSSIHWGETGIIIMESDDKILGPCCTRRSDQNRVMTKVDLMLD